MNQLELKLSLQVSRLMSQMTFGSLLQVKVHDLQVRVHDVQGLLHDKVRSTLVLLLLLWYLLSLVTMTTCCQAER